MNIQILIVVILVILLILAAILTFALRRAHPKDQTLVPKKFETDANHKQIYVGNLSYAVTENDLQLFFQSYGMIREVRVVRNTKTGRSKGFAFISYDTIAASNEALTAHGKPFQGRKLVVRIAKTQKPVVNK